MSYRKYLACAVSPLPENLREKALADFDVILNEIADMYLELAGRMQDKFHITKLAQVHGRNTELVRLFEESRKPYIERKKILDSLTNNPAKLESIKDYVSMPALPFYIFGAKTILQADSMDEADSYRKCRRAHRSAFLNFACLLFPEMLSADGRHTLYCASLSDKDYGNYREGVNAS